MLFIKGLPAVLSHSDTCINAMFGIGYGIITQEKNNAAVRRSDSSSTVRATDTL